MLFTRLVTAAFCNRTYAITAFIPQTVDCSFKMLHAMELQLLSLYLKMLTHILLFVFINAFYHYPHIIIRHYYHDKIIQSCQFNLTLSEPLGSVMTGLRATK